MKHTYPDKQSTHFNLVYFCATLMLMQPLTANALSAISASVSSNYYTCSDAFGLDPYCGVTQVMLPDERNQLLDASAGSSVSAGYSYIDPALGTAVSTSGNAQSSFGALHAGAMASASSAPPLTSNQPYNRRVNTFSIASFTDMITITSPGHSGQTGTVSGSFVVDGSLYADTVNAKPSTHTVSAASWNMAIGVGNSQFGSASNTPGFHGVVFNRADGSSTSGGFEDGIVTFTAPITFGEATRFFVYFRTDAYAVVDAASAKPLSEGLTAASANANYMHTALWNGISSVAYQGQALTGYSVTSDSGTNYAVSAAVVPIPSVAWLFGLASAGLVKIRRRK